MDTGNSKIVEEMLKVASNNYTLDPVQVLLRSRELFASTLQFHVAMMQKMSADQQKDFDAAKLVKALLAEVETHVLKNIKPLQPKSKVVRLAPVVLAGPKIL